MAGFYGRTQMWNGYKVPDAKKRKRSAQPVVSKPPGGPEHKLLIQLGKIIGESHKKTPKRGCNILERII